MSLYNELKRRNVLRVGAAYVVASWLLIQVAETIFPLFGFDDTPARIVVIVLAIGFPLFLLFSWVFELTPEGLKREAEIARAVSTTRKTGKKLDRVIIVLLALALGYFAFDKFVLDPVRDVGELAIATQEAHQEGRSEALVGVDMSFPTGQSNLNLHTSGDCSNGAQRKRDKTTFTRTRTRQ